MRELEAGILKGCLDICKSKQRFERKEETIYDKQRYLHVMEHLIISCCMVKTGKIG